VRRHQFQKLLSRAEGGIWSGIQSTQAEVKEKEPVRKESHTVGTFSICYLSKVTRGVGKNFWHQLDLKKGKINREQGPIGDTTSKIKASKTTLTGG
jgi:hypothetical protein